MAITYLRLFPATQQFELRNGQLDVAGQLKVFYEGTDDLAGVYDVDGSQLPQPVILDDNGRAQGLFVDSARVYRLEVYDRYGELLYTVRKMVPSGGGAGSALGNTYEIVSSDGSIEINSTEEGSKTTYDIGIAPGNSDEFLEWCKCADSGVIDGSLYPTMTDGTMESAGGQGLHVGKDRFYHITSSFKVYPKGDGINYETLVAKLMFNDGEDHQVTVRGFDIDNSVQDPVLAEFSYDFKAPEDGYLFLDIDGASAFSMVDCELQVHRIYSGINAVPDTCATKPFVSANYQPLTGMSSYVAYSAISGNTASQITGIGGSAIAGSLDSATVSSIASSVASAYTESAFSSISAWSADISSISAKMDISGMTAYATTAFVESSLSGKLDASASSMFITALPADMATTGDIASAVSGKLDNSASSTWYPMTGNPSGFLTAVPAGYATTGDVASAVSGKLDTSAFSGVSGNFVQNSSFTSYTSNVDTTINNISSSINSMSSDVSGKVDQSAMSAWIPYSALDYSGTAISGIGGSSLAGMGGGGADYTGIYPINVDNTAREIAVDSLPLVTDSSMTSYASGDSSVIGVNLDIMSGKLDSSAQVVTATATQLYAGTAYLTSVNGAPVSASRAGNAANASLANSAYYDGTGRLISSLPDRASVSAIASLYTMGKQDTLTFGYDAANRISSIDGSALAGGGGGGGAYVSPSGTIVVAGNTLEGTNSAALTAASGGYFNALSLATFPDVTLSTTPTQLTYATLDNTSTGGEFILDFDSPLYGGTLFISGRDSAYNTASASAGLENGPYTASVPQGPIVNQIYAWTDGTWLHAVGLTASAAPQVYASGVGKLAWESSVSSKLDTTAFSTVSGSFLTAVPGTYATKTYVDSSVSSKLDSTAFSTVSAGFLTAVPAGYASETYVDSSVSGKQDSSAMSAYVPFSAISADGNSAITSINGSSIGGGTQVVTATGSASVYGTGISTINGSSIIAKSLSAGGLIVGYSDPGMYITGGNNGGTAYYKSNELVINRSGYGETIKFNLGSAGSQIYGSATGTRGAFMQMNNDNHTAFFGALSGGDAKIELDGYSAGSANMAGWDSSWNTVSSESATWGAVTAKMDSTAVQSAYASASATQATAQGVLYILIPDGV